MIGRYWSILFVVVPFIMVLVMIDCSNDVIDQFWNSEFAYYVKVQ